MKPFLIRCLFFVLTVSACRAQSASESAPVVTYRNPVIAGDFADPSVIRVGNTYYAVGTSSEWGPPYPVYSSPDLVNWTPVGPVFREMPAWTMGSYWAPELFHRNGTFFVYYTARRKSDKRSYIGVATTRDIRKGFTDHGCLLEWTSEAIDAFVIEDAGKLYITWKAYGLDKGRAIEILGAELSSNGLKVVGEAFPLLKASRDDWEAGGAEGQALFKHGRYFYMTYSGNACCGARCNYQVGLARAENLRGPWEKFAGNPVLVSSDAWKCPGHGTVVTTPDKRYFYLHHAYQGQDFTFTGRQCVLSELIWDEKTQWPLFRHGDRTPERAESPANAPQKNDSDLVVDFSKPQPVMPWVWDVSRPRPEYSVRNGRLQLGASGSGTVGSFLGLVVKKGDYSLSTEIDPQPGRLQSIAVYGDADNALGLGVQQDRLELWQVKDGRRQVLHTQALPARPGGVDLYLLSRSGRFYEFSWAPKGEKPRPITDSPVDGAFLPRWDRAPRVGISASGESKEPGGFRTLHLQNR